MCMKEKWVPGGILEPVSGKSFLFFGAHYKTSDFIADGLLLWWQWNTLYMDAVLAQLRHEGYPVRPEDEARLSPFGREHINLLGRYSFSVPEAVARGELRPLGKASET